MTVPATVFVKVVDFHGLLQVQHHRQRPRQHQLQPLLPAQPQVRIDLD